MLIRRILVLLSILSLTAINSLSADKTLVFGFVTKSTDSVYSLTKIAAEDKARSLSKEKGINIKIDWRPSGSGPKEQAKIVEQMIKDGVNAIAISASDPEDLAPLINNAASKGVPVVTFESDSPTSNRLSFVGTDDTYAGQKIMSELAERIKNEGIVAVLACNQDDPALKRRVEGVREEAKRHPKIKILDVYYCGDTSADAARTIEQVMRSHPEITSWAMVCGLALSADYTPKWQPGSVTVVAMDTFITDRTIDYLKTGYVQTLVIHEPMEWGEESVRILYDKVAENKNPPTGFAKSDLIPVTKADLEGFAKNWEKWLPK
jgi:ribose transport system substrate-binding protein